MSTKISKIERDLVDFHFNRILIFLSPWFLFAFGAFPHSADFITFFIFFFLSFFLLFFLFFLLILYTICLTFFPWSRLTYLPTHLHTSTYPILLSILCHVILFLLSFLGLSVNEMKTNGTPPPFDDYLHNLNILHHIAFSHFH